MRLRSKLFVGIVAAEHGRRRRGEVKATIDRLEEIEEDGETSLGLAAENGRLLKSFERDLTRFRT